MPLRGKIVVIKRSGGDGTEFPLTASCLFGRKAECDIRIQLPQVSKEHCKIDLNENKEIILTNLSSANPTRVNGEALSQSERLKHGDVITIVDRSFRFEYPTQPTPKKRTSAGGKSESLKVLRDQQVSDVIVSETAEKRSSQVSTDPPLKDGANNNNIQRSLDKTLEMEPAENGKNDSPFSDLYQMIKHSLDIKTPRKSSANQAQTPSSRFCTPKPGTCLKKLETPVVLTPRKIEAKLPADDQGKETPESAKKKRRSIPVPSKPASPRAENPSGLADVETRSPRRSGTPKRYSLSEVIELVSVEPSKSPVGLRSNKSTPANSSAQATPSPKNKTPQRTSSRNSAEKVKDKSKKRKSGELGSDLPMSVIKKKRVSFGGYLSPELFDKRLPPDSPLRKGAAPRRSLSLLRPKQTLLRRASVIGLLKNRSHGKTKTPSPQKSVSKTSTSPKAGRETKSPKSKSSPKPASPGKKSPQSRSSSPAQKSLKSRSPSPKPATPGKKSPQSRSSSPKAASPAKKSPKPRPSSPEAKTAKMSKGTSSPAGNQKSPKQLKTQPNSGATPNKMGPKAQKPASPVKTPSTSGIPTPTVQGRFSVSRISTPSPTTEVEVQGQTQHAVTPKMPIKRKSMKSISHKTPTISRSAKKMLHRRTGISRASMKVKNSYADIVKFGQIKAAAAAPVAKNIAVKTQRRRMPKPQTPARKLKAHVGTGHADSPATIVVGRAHKRTVAQPGGAAPRVVLNTALFKKDLKMDEDLSGLSEMFKTPANERKRRSVMGSATKTPARALSSSVAEPSVLKTPEEPGEMVVSPMTMASTIKSRRYNSEAVQRLLNADQEAGFETSPLVHSEKNEEPQMSETPKQKLELPECLTGVKRIMKTPRQKPELVEDLRGRLLKTPKQKLEQRECLTGVKRIMKTPRQKPEPLEDLRGKILRTPRQKAKQQECLTGVKRIMKTPRQKAEAIEDIRGKLLITPKQKPEHEECLTGVKRIFKTPKQKSEPLEDLHGNHLQTPKTQEVVEVTLDGVKELLETPKQQETPPPEPKDSPNVHAGVGPVTETSQGAPAEDSAGRKRLAKTPREKGKPVEDNFGLRRLMKSPRLKGNAPVEDFDGLQELMEEPLDHWAGAKTNEVEDNGTLYRAVCDGKELSENADIHQHTKMSENDTDESSEAIRTLCEDKENVPQGPPEAKAETDAGESLKMESVRGRRGVLAAPEGADLSKGEEPKDSVNAAPIRARRTKKTEAVAPPAGRPTRGRNAKAAQSEDVKLSAEDKTSVKTKKGRSAKNTSGGPEEMDCPTSTEKEETPDSAVPLLKAEVKPKRGRKLKQAEEPAPAEQPGLDATKGANEEGSKQQVDTVHIVETPLQAPQADIQPVVEKTASVSIPERKSARSAKAKPADSEAPQEEAAEKSNQPIAPAQVSGRRGKKAEPSAPPAGKPLPRTRKAKTQEGTCDQPAVEMESVQASVAPSENPISKPLRGRKAKVEPERAEDSNVKPTADNCPPEKPKRGRKAKMDAGEQNKAAEEIVEIKQESPPPVRAKRERKLSCLGETANPEEPAKKPRTRKHKDDPVEPTEELKKVEVGKQATISPKPTRGRKAEVQPTEAPEVPAGPKAKGGRRGKRVAPEVSAAELTEATPVKRALRSAAPAEGTAAEAANPAPEQPPARRGRQKPKANEEAPETIKENSKKPRKMVKWEPDVQVLEIPNVTPVKAVRGRRTKVADQAGDAKKPEEEDLSEVRKAQPVTRGRRGVKAAEPASEEEPAEAAPQQRTRRGRSATK